MTVVAKVVEFVSAPSGHHRTATSLKAEIEMLEAGIARPVTSRSFGQNLIATGWNSSWPISCG
jgi:hypothetical protein